MLEFHIACPMYNYSNIATTLTPKYKVVYQPSNDNEGKQDHNMKDQIRCDNCDNNFDFYWCTGHSIMENNKESGTLNGAFIHSCIVIWRKVYKKYVSTHSSWTEKRVLS